MTRHVVAAVAAALATTVVLAGQEAGVRTVRLTEPLMAGGQLLQPGTYQVRLVGPAPSATQRDVEFVVDGKVVARETAEMSTPVGVAGTSSAAGAVKVEKLKGDEFVRISFVQGDVRYLIYLPVPAS